MTNSTDPVPARPRVRRREERGHQDLGWSENHLTFSFANYHAPDWMHFGPLRVLIESRIEPHEGFPAHPHRNVEILSYVTSGVLRHRDQRGHEADIPAGGMQVISAGREGVVHSETNPLDRPEVHYQLWFAPDRPDTAVAYHQRPPQAEAQAGQFTLFVSPDGRTDTLPINTDAYVYVGHFSPADAAHHRLAGGRGAWVQIVAGTVTVNGLALRAGDGVGLTAPGNHSFSFAENSEVLLIDVQRDVPRQE